MFHERLAVFLVPLALLMASRGHCVAQKVTASPSITKRVLSLSRANDGQRVAATVGQPIEVTLQTIGPGQYDTPQISSPAIRFESVVLKMPPNPGGPTQVFRFAAAAEGEAKVQVPHTAANPTFAVTIRVTKH
jgi:hypothetical protein